MKHVVYSLFMMLLCCSAIHGQNPFQEGIVQYKITMHTPDGRQYSGIYNFTFKGQQVKKDLKLTNGYEDIIIYDCGKNTVYSLQNKNGKKYAVQLSMEDYQKDQQKYKGYRLTNENSEQNKVAGCTAMKGKIAYKDGDVTKIVYTNDWYPTQSITFDRFPDARFFPLTFSYTDDKGLTMKFEAVKFDPQAIENATFRIPADYRIISYNEYKELVK